MIRNDRGKDMNDGKENAQSTVPGHPMRKTAPEGDGPRPGAREEASAGQPERLNVEWREPPGFIWLSVRNFLLKIITLGIYHFWGKTEVRRRLWNAIRVNGEPLEYTGTGGELFKGFLLVLLLVGGGIVLYAIMVAAITGGDETMMDLLSLPLYAILFWLAGLAIYRAWRYRLRRTRWRGIRGTLAGSPVKYANAYFLTGLLLPLTLGWASPWRARKLHTIMTRDTRLGSTPLRMEPEPALGPLYRVFAPLWFVSILSWVLLGLAVVAFAMRAGEALDMPAPAFVKSLSTPMLAALVVIALMLPVWLWLRYSARSANWLTSHVRLHGGHFRLTLEPGGLFRLWLGNLLITLLSLGILLPVAQKRTARYMVNNLTFEGTVDLAQLTQATDALERSGEGLGEFFDIDGL